MNNNSKAAQTYERVAYGRDGESEEAQGRLALLILTSSAVAVAAAAAVETSIWRFVQQEKEKNTHKLLLIQVDPVVNQSWDSLPCH